MSQAGVKATTQQWCLHSLTDWILGLFVFVRSASSVKATVKHCSDLGGALSQML